MIIVSICTIPGRINSLIEVLKSIENQSLMPDKILITISEYYPRSKKYYKIPDIEKLIEFIKDYKIETHINKLILDIGPSLKILSPLSYFNLNQDDFIVTFDDDSIPYSKSIEILHTSYRKNPESIYGLMGVRENKFIHTEMLPKDYDYYVVDTLGGYRGIIYPKSLIEDDFVEWVYKIINIHNQEDLVAMHDDQIFSYYFKYKGIQRRVAKFISDGSDEMKYYPIENKDGIFNDPETLKSLEIINKYLSISGLDWILSNPY